MPKICVAKCNSNSGTMKPVYVAVPSREFLSKKLQLPGFRWLPRCPRPRVGTSPPKPASMPPSLGSDRALGLLVACAVNSVRTSVQYGLSSQLPFTLGRCWKDDSYNMTHVIAVVLYSPGGPQVKITNMNYEKSIMWFKSRNRPYIPNSVAA